MDNVRYEHWGDVPETDDNVEGDVGMDIMTPLASDEKDVDDLSVPTATGTLSIDGYFQSLQQRSATKQRLAYRAPGSTRSSSGSLHTLAEEGQSFKSHGRRGRSVSQTKRPPSPTTRPAFYPEQSFASLSGQHNTPRPHPILRTRSSYPAQNLLYNDIKAKPSSPGRKTADNTPMSSPGLFSPTSIRQAHESRSGTPQLHHLQAPKETHTAEIEHDVYSGNKFINNYEIVSELGRGEHGKVKLGRDIERDDMVAIKIVPRYSAKRRLGKLGAPEDRTKREVAILKKARHPHVVSLLEVIDDPNKNKVYLILEHVDKGEIKWRKSGVREVCMINTRRYEEEKRGIHVSLQPSEKDLFTVRQAGYRHDQNERSKDRAFQHVPNWSLEYAGDTDEESEVADLSRSVSRQMTHSSTPSRGNSQDESPTELREVPSWSGTYGADIFRNRKFSVAMSAISHMSSEIEFDRDDDQHAYVPALTIEETRGAFRDILLGLEFLHYIGIIHRDIKPANLLVTSTGNVKISDFGVSYLGRPTTEEEADNKVSESDATPLDNEKELARSVGTPAFWAPEVCYEDPAIFADGKDPKITGALDLWALGITLYCMVYARLPFYLSEGVGLHTSVCTEQVFCPSTRLVPVDTTSSQFLTYSREPIDIHKRLDYDLKFEYVPEHVRDLISRLLTKDPAYRITIEEAKRHPWVVEGIRDQSEWFHGPEIENEGMKNIHNINEKELSHAVVKRNIIERTINSVSRLAGNLLGRSNKDARKRASSTVTSAGSSSESLHSPATSSGSTIGKTDKVKEARRTSLRGEELVHALKASRDAPEHPLAQSQMASPDVRDQPSYFSGAKSISTGNIPTLDERRPRGPDRSASVLSTAESVKTIRASQFQRIDTSLNTEIDPGTSLKSRIDGLWEGNTKTVNRFTSRDRSTRSRPPSRQPSESDGHAGPSLAVSNTYATGDIQAPNVLRPKELSPVRLHRSPSDVLRATELSPVRSHHSPFRAPASAESEYAHAQQMNHRRHIQEAQLKIENVADKFGSTLDECPPSPDDEIFDKSIQSSLQMSPAGTGMQTAVSASTIASSLDQYDSSSVSGPSHGINSGASSPPEGFISAEYKDIVHHHLHTADVEPEFMRTADTVTMHGRIQPSYADGKPLQQEHEYLDEDDSDEEGIVMGGPKRYH